MYNLTYIIPQLLLLPCLIHAHTHTHTTTHTHTHTGRLSGTQAGAGNNGRRPVTFRYVHLYYYHHIIVLYYYSVALTAEVLSVNIRYVH